MAAAQTLAPTLWVGAGYEALAVLRATYYRQRSGRFATARLRRCPSPRALSQPKRKQVLGTLDSEPFVNAVPRQVYAALLNEGISVSSVRTMHRTLAEAREARERRDQLRRPVYEKPELLATGPKQVWNWDLTKLKNPARWAFYYLHVILPPRSQQPSVAARMNPPKFHRDHRALIAQSKALPTAADLAPFEVSPGWHPPLPEGRPCRPPLSIDPRTDPTTGEPLRFSLP